jgi:alanine racemase
MKLKIFIKYMSKTRKNKTIKKKIVKNKTCKINYIPAADKDIKAIIDVKCIKHNINFLRKKTKTDIMPVLKADAYGHGLIEIAKILRKLNVKYIGVATIGEAILLRKSGDKGRILSWLYDVDGPEFKDSLKLNLDISIFDEKLIPKIEKMIPDGKKVKVTMFVDTGINRAGISYDKSLQAFKDVAKCNKFELVGMMSHLVCSEIVNSPIVNEQLRKFRQLRSELEEIGINPPLVHIANTGACLNYDVSDFTLSRSGSGLYGIPGLDEVDKNLKLAMTVKSYIIQLKDIEKGQGIGYDWKYITPKKMRVAVLPIGYGDIIPESSSGKLYVYINGTKRKVLGTISMDQIIVEAKEKDKINDDAIIFGNGSNCPQTIFDVAKAGNTPPIEILCHTGYRINRTYINR